MSRRTIAVLLGLALAGGVVANGVAGVEEKIALDQVPPPAREALLKLAGGAPIAKIEREEKHDGVLYAAEWELDGREAEAVVTADGDVVEQEQEIDAAEAPAAVRAVAASAFPPGTTVKYEKIVIVVYELEGKVHGIEKEILVQPSGTILRVEDDGDDDDDDDVDPE